MRKIKVPKINLKRLMIRVFCILGLSLVGCAAITLAFVEGIDLGKDVGRCEFACELSGGTFLALDDNSCQCQGNGTIKWVYSVSNEFLY